MDITPVKFKFKYNLVYLTFVTVALTILVIGIILILWALLHEFTWHRAISAFLFSLLLSSFFNDLPRTLVANHDGITIKKIIGSANFPMSDIIDIREPDAKSFKVSFIGAGYRTSEKRLSLISTYVTQKVNILILEVKFGSSQLKCSISCPNEEAKKQLLNYMSQLRKGRGEYKEA